MCRFRSEILYGNSQFSILTDSDGRTFGRKELMIGNPQTRHRILHRVHNQFGRIGIEPIGFESIDIDSGQCSRHFMLHDISKSILFGSSGRNIPSIQFSRAIEIPVISLLFGQTETDIISIALSLVFNGKLHGETLTGIDHLIVIAIYKAIHTYHQHSRIYRNRNRRLLLRHIFRLLQRLIVCKQPIRK